MKKIIILTIFLVFSIAICAMGYKLNECENKLNKCKNELTKCETELKECKNTMKEMEYNEIHIRNTIKRKGLRGYFYDAPRPVQIMLDKLAVTIAPPIY